MSMTDDPASMSSVTTQNKMQWFEPPPISPPDSKYGGAWRDTLHHFQK